MPLLRQSLYCQNVNLYLAPTADARDTWLPLMQTVAGEGRCVVLSANQCMTKSNLPAWITGQEDEPKPLEEYSLNGHAPTVPRFRRRSTITDEGNEIVLPDISPSSTESPTKPRPKPESTEFVCRGGSCIISPLGEVLAGPLWDNENGLLTVDIDFDDCLRGRLDLDVGGSYSRSDSFKLSVEGLDLSPPP